MPEASRGVPRPRYGLANEELDRAVAALPPEWRNLVSKLNPEELSRVLVMSGLVRATAKNTVPLDGGAGTLTLPEAVRIVHASKES